MGDITDGTACTKAGRCAWTDGKCKACNAKYSVYNAWCSQTCNEAGACSSSCATWCTTDCRCLCTDGHSKYVAGQLLTCIAGEYKTTTTSTNSGSNGGHGGDAGQAVTTTTTTTTTVTTQERQMFVA